MFNKCIEYCVCSRLTMMAKKYIFENALTLVLEGARSWRLNVWRGMGLLKKFGNHCTRGCTWTTHCSAAICTGTVSLTIWRCTRGSTWEKSYSCPQCEKRFSHQHQLKMHLKIHTEERPFACMHCWKRFQRGATSGYTNRKCTRPMYRVVTCNVVLVSL
jgi:DNA-directed RNA polymerase subunit RPC12/RpoP